VVLPKFGHIVDTNSPSIFLKILYSYPIWIHPLRNWITFRWKPTIQRGTQKTKAPVPCRHKTLQLLTATWGRDAPNGRCRCWVKSCENVYVWMYVCMYVCLNVCMYVCMYVCIEEVIPLFPGQLPSPDPCWALVRDSGTQPPVTKAFTPWWIETARGFHHKTHGDFNGTGGNIMAGWWL